MSFLHSFRSTIAAACLALVLPACDSAPQYPSLAPPDDQVAEAVWHSPIERDAGDLHFDPLEVREGQSVSATLTSASAQPCTALARAAGKAEMPPCPGTSIAIVSTRGKHHHRVSLESTGAPGSFLASSELVFVEAGDHSIQTRPGSKSYSSQAPRVEGQGGQSPVALVRSAPRSVHFAQDGQGNTIVMFDFARDGTTLVGPGADRAVSHVGFRLRSPEEFEAWAELRVQSPSPMHVSHGRAQRKDVLTRRPHILLTCPP